MHGIIAVNGKMYDPQSAAIPAMDRGFLFGDNVFEVLVAFKNKILDIDRHLNRLRVSAEQLNLPVHWSNEELSFELHSIAEKLNLKKMYLRLVITRGVGVGLEFPIETQAHKIIYAFPAKSVPENLQQKGMWLQLRQLPHTERGPSVKTGNYLRSILALNNAQGKGFDDVIWCNSESEITESTTANLFFIGRHGDLVEISTPSLRSGILKGITRETILTLLNSAKIPARELIVYKDELPRFDEAFCCSTVKGLIPITKIDKHQLHTLRANSTFRHINRLFQTWVASEIGHYVDWNTGDKIKDL